MIKDAKIEEVDEVKTILMCDMKPYDIGVLMGEGDRKDMVVMRTASTGSFEVMTLSGETSENECWEMTPKIAVRLLKTGSKITLTVA